jgi:hypothetical protein
MAKEQISPGEEAEPISVEELEAKLKLRPDDIELMKRLASALAFRYIYGEEEQQSGNESDIKRVRKILRELPEDRALFPRAYVAYLDGDQEEFIDKLVRFAQHEESVRPFSSEELHDHFIAPFDASSKLWLSLSDALSQVRPESASVLTL